MKLWEFFVEAIFWVQIFLAPLLAGCLMAVLIYLGNSRLLPLAVLFIVLGFVAGIVIAERIKKKYGCSRYLSRIISTPDIWLVDDEPNEKATNK